MMTTWVSPEWLEVWRVLGALLGTLLLAAGTLWAGAMVTAQVRGLWRSVRGVHPRLVAAVDEAEDPLLQQLARLTAVPAGVWAAFLPAFLDALAVGLDRALGEEDPGVPVEPAAVAEDDRAG